MALVMLLNALVIIRISTTPHMYDLKDIKYMVWVTYEQWYDWYKNIRHLITKRKFKKVHICSFILFFLEINAIEMPDVVYMFYTFDLYSELVEIRLLLLLKFTIITLQYTRTYRPTLKHQYGHSVVTLPACFYEEHRKAPLKSNVIKGLYLQNSPTLIFYNRLLPQLSIIKYKRPTQWYLTLR